MEDSKIELKQPIAPILQSGLTPLVDVTINNKDCIVLKVRPGRCTDLIATGVFRGDETQFRVRKSSDEMTDITVWRSGQVSEFSDIHVSAKYKDRGMHFVNVILDCVCVDFGTCVGYPELRSTDKCYYRVTDKYKDPDGFFVFTSNLRDSGASNAYRRDVYRPNTVRFNAREIADGLFWEYKGLSQSVLNVYSADALASELGSSTGTDKAKYKLRPTMLRGELQEDACTTYDGFSVGGYLCIKVSKSLTDSQYTVHVMDKQSGKQLGCVNISGDELVYGFNNKSGIESLYRLIPGVDRIGDDIF